MLKFMTVLGLGLALAATAAQADMPAPQLEADIQALIGSTFKLAGPVTITADQRNVAFGKNPDRAVVLTVPVVFARTAKLGSDLHATTGFSEGWDNDVVMPAGTPLYHAVYRRLATVTTPLDVWCGDHSYVWGINHDRTGHALVCVTPPRDGKSTAFFEAQTNEYGFGGGYYPSSPRWFAFALTDGHTLPFDAPAITEDSQAVSPTLTLSLKIETPYTDKKTGVQTGDAYWTLSGAPGSDPAISNLLYQPVAVANNRISLQIGSHVMTLDYLPDLKAVTHAEVGEGTVAPSDVPFIPLDYWTAFAFDGDGKETAEAVADTPWQFGAEHVKPETVTIAPGPLAKNDVLLTAQAQLGPRYKLDAALSAYPRYPGAEAGTAVYPASETTASADGTLYRNDFWCMAPVPSARRWSQCVPATPQTMIGGLGRSAWQLTPHTVDVFEGAFVTPHVAMTANDYYRPLKLSPDPDPAPTTETVQMRIGGVHDGYVEVRLGLMNGDKFTIARVFTLSFDGSGLAELHLWDRLVRLHRDGKTVTAEVSADASGEGPQRDPDHIYEQD